MSSLPKKRLKPLTVRFDEDTYNMLQVLAEQRGEPMAVIARRIIEEDLLKQRAVDSLDVINSAIRKTIRAELKLVEDRMAKLSAKSAIAGATGMYLNYFVIQQALGSKLSKSAREVYDTARVKAVAYLKEPESGDE
ncbi:MAG: hypothetical protein FH756_17515 [Firmicutes bacterium]|nr:hypothetical protein [Bacillota bacterium]